MEGLCKLIEGLHLEDFAEYIGEDYFLACLPIDEENVCGSHLTSFPNQ